MVVPSTSLSDRQRNRQLIQDPSGAGLPSHGDEEGMDQAANECLRWREVLSVRAEDAEHCCASPRDEGLVEGEQQGGREMEEGRLMYGNRTGHGAGGTRQAEL